MGISGVDAGICSFTNLFVFELGKTYQGQALSEVSHFFVGAVRDVV